MTGASSTESDPADGRRAAHDAMAQALFECRRSAGQLGIERQHLQDAIDGLRDEAQAAARRDAAPRIEAAERDRDRARAERDGLLAERDQALAERDRARAEAHDAAAKLHHVTSSTAWRVTGPARRLLQAWLGR